MAEEVGKTSRQTQIELTKQQILKETDAGKLDTGLILRDIKQTLVALARKQSGLV